MPFTEETLRDKPYNRCITCDHIGIICDGPNFLAMTPERWCEWCKIRKEYLGWTSSHIAELAGVSKVSVDRIISGTIKDIRISTMQAVTKVLVNGSWGQYPCSMAAEEIAAGEKSAKECERLRAELDSAREDDRRKINFLKEQLESKDCLLRERYDFLKRKDKIIVILSILLFIAVLSIIIALAIDRSDPNVGFFWRDTLAAVFERTNAPNTGPTAFL